MLFLQVYDWQMKKKNSISKGVSKQLIENSLKKRGNV